ncbi:MAG: TonB-dependent receptor [Bacteroidia bacterium]|nr:TonB-dependent receptor [Bacteroidia bacterium]
MPGLTFRRNILRIFLFIFLLFAAHISFSQDLNKKITVKAKEKPLGEVIKEIGDLGQINFSYSSSLIEVDKKITLKAKNKTIKEILDELLAKYDLEYMIVENQVILKSQKKEDRQDEEMKTSETEKTKPKFTVSGYLKDHTNGEVLIGASVFAKGTNAGTTTNAYGFYSITLPESKYEMVYSFIGYKNYSQEVDLKKNQKISIEMEVSSAELKEVEIVAEGIEAKIKDNQQSEMKLSPKTLSQMPGFVGDVDVIKSLQAIPGIKTYGDGSTMFYVRGGNSDQNLLLIDEAPIYNPSHLFGFFSALAPDAIKDVQAFKGDFPANYGDRLSSVIDIKSKDGNLKKFGFAGSLGPFTSNLSLEGPIVTDRSSFFVSGRISNLFWLNYTNFYDKTLDILFYDINTKLNYKLNENNRLYLTFYTGNDDLSRITNSSVSTFGISWNNIVGSLRWNHIFNDRLFSNTTVYSSQYRYYLFVAKEHNDYWSTTISHSAMKTDLTYYLNPKNTIKTGVEFSIHFSNPGNLHFSDEEVQKNAPQIPMYTSLEYVGYISNEQELTKKISLRYGFRFPVWQNIGATTVYYFDNSGQVYDTLQVNRYSAYKTYISPEPRVNIKYSINNKSSLKASYSRTSQFMQIISNSTSPFTSLEVFVPCGPNVLPQRADQYAMGYFRQFLKHNLYFSAEAFYKRFYNQVDYKDHANMLNNPLFEGELRFGKAWSYGAEFMLRKSEGKFTGWIGYTYSRTFKLIYGVNNNESFPAFYDRPNNICMNISYNTNKRWSFSANWLFLTGGAITTPTGFYYYNGYQVPVYDKKNNDQLPDYHRLDVAVTFRINKPERHYQHNLTFTIYNAYGKENPISINFNKIMTDNGKFVVPSNLNGDYMLIPTALSVAGIIPSLTYNFKF